MLSAYILHEPVWLGGTRDCDSLLGKGNCSIFIMRLMERQRDRSVVGKVLSVEGPEVTSRRERRI